MRPTADQIKSAIEQARKVDVEVDGIAHVGAEVAAPAVAAAAADASAGSAGAAAAAAAAPAAAAAAPAARPAAADASVGSAGAAAAAAAPVDRGLGVPLGGGRERVEEILISGRDPRAPNASINGVYTVLVVMHARAPAFIKMSERPSKVRYLFFDAESLRFHEHTYDVRALVRTSVFDPLSRVSTAHCQTQVPFGFFR